MADGKTTTNTTTTASAVAAAAAKPHPLPNFKRLNHKTWLYDPAASSSTAAAHPGAPSLILLCSWMDASPRHVAKYTTYYQTLYPATPILLVTSATADFFFNTKARQKKELAPAVAAICSFVPPAAHAAKQSSILAHALSNGGCGHLAMIAEQYRLVAGRPLPAGAVVYDSAPGKSRFKQGFVAMSMALPRFPLVRWPMQAAIALLLFLFFHLPPMLGSRSLSMVMRDHLNAVDRTAAEAKGKGRREATTAFLRPEAPRTYVYSRSDPIILAADVEEHAAEAEAHGLSVRRETFEGTPHVGHMRADPERYWGIIHHAWVSRA